MSEKIGNPTDNQDENSKWDILTEETPEDNQDEAATDEEILGTYLRMREADKERAKPHAIEIAKDSLVLQRQFANQLQRVTERGEKHISEKEFEAWEDEFAGQWKQLLSELWENELYSAEDEAEVESHAITSSIDSELSTNIEAQAGHFYEERRSALMTAIRESNSESKEADLDAIRNFRHLVLSHLDFKYTSQRGMDSYEARMYEQDRTNSHNAVIEGLNELNNLAKKYGTRPFTARNFWSSRNWVGSKQSDGVRRKLRYDRDLVEEYYAIAFRYDEEDAKKRSKEWY